MISTSFVPLLEPIKLTLNELNEQGMNIQNWVDMSSIRNYFCASQMNFLIDLDGKRWVSAPYISYVSPIGKYQVVFTKWHSKFTMNEIDRLWSHAHIAIIAIRHS